MFTLDIGIGLGIGLEGRSIDKAFNICDEIETSLNKLRDSSGCGFGARDMQFEFNTKDEAKIAEEKVREIFKKYNINISAFDSYISVFNNDENNEGKI